MMPDQKNQHSSDGNIEEILREPVLLEGKETLYEKMLYLPDQHVLKNSLNFLKP